MGNDLGRTSIVTVTQEKDLRLQREIFVQGSGRLFLGPGIRVLDSINDSLHGKLLLRARLAKVLRQSTIHLSSQALQQKHLSRKFNVADDHTKALVVQRLDLVHTLSPGVEAVDTVGGLNHDLVLAPHLDFVLEHVIRDRGHDTLLQERPSDIHALSNLGQCQSLGLHIFVLVGNVDDHGLISGRRLEHLYTVVSKISSVLDSMHRRESKEGICAFEGSLTQPFSEGGNALDDRQVKD